MVVIREVVVRSRDWRGCSSLVLNTRDCVGPGANVRCWGCLFNEMTRGAFTWTERKSQRVNESYSEWHACWDAIDSGQQQGDRDVRFYFLLLPSLHLDVNQVLVRVLFSAPNKLSPATMYTH